MQSRYFGCKNTTWFLYINTIDFLALGCLIGFLTLVQTTIEFLILFPLESLLLTIMCWSQLFPGPESQLWTISHSLTSCL